MSDMKQANVEGVVNGDPVRRGDLNGHVTGVWNDRYLQVIWSRPGPIIFNMDGFTKEEVKGRFQLPAGGIWEILPIGHESKER